MKAGLSAGEEARADGGPSSGELLAAQRSLRARLLDRPTVRYAPARDLAAHMLLSLDDLPKCWFLATTWLRDELRCHRVDSGFGTQQAADYFPGLSEAKNTDFDVPSFGGGKSVDNRDRVMQAMWLERRPLILADIKQDSRVSLKLRQRLAGARTKSKFAGALRVHGRAYGLICADWTEHFAPWESGLYECFEYTVADVLGPIIAVSRQYSDWSPVAESGPTPDGHDGELVPAFRSLTAMAKLTPSEIEVARLVARGLSYKEIAAMRGRALSTIDHQLRSIREKTGVSSTSALVSLLARLEA